ncbi:MBL fold metallo-hydrolase [Streptomyces sp. NPDC050625]|uniref:MBL fold metallo-hydrolase n=1 Tax=Streptomyces sp. NPDC050625 TaxID=3154629 RepID=UPI00342C6E55
MQIRRLGWAGIEIEAAGGRAVIDAVTAMPQLAQLIGPPRTTLLPPTGPVDLALVTHLHEDHTDAAALAAALDPDGTLLRPAAARGAAHETLDTAVAEAGLAEHKVPARIVEPWQSVSAGPFTATAVPAVDGLGAPQLSWVVEADGRRILHCGDTLFHGYWWQIAHRLGPFDAVFLPVNGAVCAFPHLHPASPYPVDLDPGQAAAAAHLLGARLAVPIHYDTLHGVGVYEQVDAPSGAFTAACDKLGIPSRELDPGDTLDLPPRAGEVEAETRNDRTAREGAVARGVGRPGPA